MSMDVHIYHDGRIEIRPRTEVPNKVMHEARKPNLTTRYGKQLEEEFVLVEHIMWQLAASTEFTNGVQVWIEVS